MKCHKIGTSVEKYAGVFFFFFFPIKLQAFYTFLERLKWNYDCETCSPIGAWLLSLTAVYSGQMIFASSISFPSDLSMY